MRGAIFGSISVAALAIAGDARAQSFPPSSGWTALQKAGANVTDANDLSSGQAYNDVIGDGGNAAVELGSDASYLYFRLRLNGQPTNNGGAWRSSWGCVIDADGVSNTYEYLATLDGANDEVRFRPNAATSPLDSPGDTCDPTISFQGASSTYARWSGSGPYFVDFAIAWGNWIPQGPSLRFACGSGTGAHIGTDPVAGSTANAAATLTNMWSTPYVCTSATGCRLDSDGDSVPDVVELARGTREDLQDSDGDGLKDSLELGIAPGFAAIDTDGDAAIDALDADSDNDCVTDLVEGAASFRNAAFPNPTPSTACGGITPFCNTSTGSCAACNGDHGGATTAPCPFPSLPACQATGACTQCKAGLTGLCGGTLPACSTATNTCSACNGDNGAAATAVCPGPSLPACHAAGALAGQCKTCSPANASLCTTPAQPACDPATGACSACDGDRDGGTNKPCPSSSKPYCVLSGGSAGQCGKCMSNADCGTGHAGPTCDIPTGACVDKDSDGDGLNDSVEKILGTDFEKRDTDGDGIDDMTETTYIVGGSPTKIDTDQDGLIDALDLDSDGDGVPDAVEGTADTDADTTANMRDADDDGDRIPTAMELDLAAKSSQADDADEDGKKNWLDTDADGDGKGDLFEGTGDDDEDGIPNFLDPDDKTKKPFDAGAPIAPAPTSPDPGGGASSSSSGAAPAGGDVVEGSGFACSASGNAPSSVVLLGLLAITIGAVRRRRRS